MIRPQLRGVAASLAALVILNLIVFGQVVGFDFVDLDDQAYVADNPAVSGGVTWLGIVAAFTTTTAANWHPATMVSHMVDAQVFGLWPGGHHLTSLVLHIANTLLLFALIRRMTGAFGRSLFVAALFAVHPLHVESVAWVAERKDVLSTLFALLAIWAYVSYVRAPALGRYALVMVWFVLGLMAKPMVVTLPFLLLLLDIWPLDRIRNEVGSSFRGTRKTTPDPVTDSTAGLWRKLVVEKLPLLLLTIVSSIVTFLVQDAAGAVAATDRLPLDVRVAHSLLSYWTYVGQMFWPVRLAAFYPFLEDAISWQRAGLAAAALAAVSAIVVRLARRFPFALTGWLWYAGLLVPVIGIVHIGNHWTADRYTYLPLVGLFIIIAWSVPLAASRLGFPRFLAPALGVAVIATCAVLAHDQTSTWRDSKTLWTHAVAVTTDNYLAHGTLGALLAREGREPESIAHLNEWTRLRGRFATEENNRGDALAREGRLEEAVAHFRQAVHIDPRLVEAHINLGFTLARLGKMTDAVAEIQEGLRLNPRQPEVHCNLAVLYHQLGDIGAARRQLEIALSVSPGYPRAVRMLADLAKGG